VFTLCFEHENLKWIILPPQVYFMTSALELSSVVEMEEVEQVLRGIDSKN